VLVVVIVRLACTSLAPTPSTSMTRPDLAPTGSPFEEALREARHWRLQALIVINEERETLEAWDPSAVERQASGTKQGAAMEAWRLQQMASDRAGHLLRAREAAQRAAALARTPTETYRAAEHLARIEHEAGRHAEELKLARKLTKLAPANPLSQITLRRALTCTRWDLLPQTPLTGPAQNR
jgi:hypothetical protein